MKKLMLSVLVVLLITSFTALGAASTPPPWQVGTGIFEVTGGPIPTGGIAQFTPGSQYNNVEGLNRNPGNLNVIYTQRQEATVRLRALAYIPCYLEMEVIGNDARYLLQSFGPGSTASSGPQGTHVLAFAGEVGGFVDSQWNFLGAGSNLQVSPNDGYYIQGCDIFSVRIWSNDHWEYKVIAGPLVNNTQQLPLDMRTASAQSLQSFGDTADAWGTTQTFSVNNTEVPIGGGLALEGKTWFHQFRVPYNNLVAAGTYEGEIVLKAVTI